jgi:hypothetical protein
MVLTFMSLVRYWHDAALVFLACLGWRLLFRKPRFSRVAFDKLIFDNFERLYYFKLRSAQISIQTNASLITNS